MASKNTHESDSRDNADEMPPERLCDAAEATLKAIAEVFEATGGQWEHPSDIMQRESRPLCLNGFSAEEIEAASGFLVRMGAIEAKRTPRRAA